MPRPHPSSTLKGQGRAPSTGDLPCPCSVKWTAAHPSHLQPTCPQQVLSIGVLLSVVASGAYLNSS